MTDLTEEWKKGELPDGCYYIDTDVGITQAMATTIFKTQKIKVLNGFIPKGRISKVLAEVPSYEQYTKLKELLKDCLENITDSWDGFIDIAAGGETAELIEKIDQALQENE